MSLRTNAAAGGHMGPPLQSAVICQSLVAFYKTDGADGVAIISIVSADYYFIIRIWKIELIC